MQKTKPFEKTLIQKQAVSIISQLHIYTMLFGGSRSGKTFILIYIIFARAIKAAGTRHLIARFRFNHAKVSLVHDIIPKVLKICFPNLKVRLDKTDYFYELPNGSTIWIGGLDDKERVEKILGNEYSTIYINESSQISWEAVETVKTRLAEQSELVNKMFFDCNPPNKKHWSYLVFVLGLDPETKSELRDKEQYKSLKMNPIDNKENISSTYMDMLNGLSGCKRKRFMDGDFTDDNEHAIWRREWIANNRQYIEYLECDRIVIGVDPAVTNNDDSDEHGIVVCGEKYIGDTVKYYVFGDYTMKGSPGEWGSEVVRLYNLFQADKVIAEVNNGGDLVESNIHNINPAVKVEKVRASRGKSIRADPVAALYEHNKVQHCGSFIDLEDELCEWNPKEPQASPNRLDALVWGISYLAGCMDGAPISISSINYSGVGM